ncbi:tRNA U34 5-methylaminomethyl-2-thiouridine-forming methyltransferase MnmC [Hoeflea marina]|uniref:tRNA U34 5-methylaminomethyl-2-thiouridine-forming methyltransferase MnmC n=2 Tax=Hoeflea marina TaxID=274592 RepID=A0A317PNE6_9HYPH|nr:tRNA (5-methylaminomethyl-2-thiouridine)(34)-methyltransferase MnmD [Hoeflea marina]PWW01759.1 tRNA U34 5-methylaminomethyl-2-thiouridine-forming methyltransferase MnmC [Hoeflea marina]
MPYSPVFGDFFYSQAGGRSEAAHVFIGGNDLVERFAAGGDLTIGELGFGTGLNFAETWRQWKSLAPAGARLSFQSFELLPLARDAIGRALAAWPELDAERMALASAWPDEPSGRVRIDFGRVELVVHCGAAIDRLRDVKFSADAWFLDGFSPARNPEMWSAELMAEMARHTAPGGTFATYSAAGWVRRNLQAAGFAVSKVAGHAGKRDMSRGVLGSS